MKGDALKIFSKRRLLTAAALTAIAALPSRHADTVIAALAECLGKWRDWPGVTAWANDALPTMLFGVDPWVASWIWIGLFVLGVAGLCALAAATSGRRALKH